MHASSFAKILKLVCRKINIHNYIKTNQNIYKNDLKCTRDISGQGNAIRNTMAQIIGSRMESSARFIQSIC